MNKKYEYPVELLADKLEEFADFLNHKDYSVCTKSSYMNGLRCFFAHGFSEITYDNVLQFRRILQDEGKASKTINLMVCAVNHYLKKTNQQIVKSLRHKEEPFAVDGMEMNDFHTMLDYLLRDKKFHWYVAVKLLASTGMRIGEAVGVKYGDFRKGFCVVYGKGNKERTVYFSHVLRETLYMYIKDKADDEYMIPYSPHYVRTALSKIKKRYNLNFKNNPHEYRRFFARQMFETTHDVALIKGLLGHESVEQTNHYIQKTYKRAMEMYSYSQNW